MFSICQQCIHAYAFQYNSTLLSLDISGNHVNEQSYLAIEEILQNRREQLSPRYQHSASKVLRAGSQVTV